MIRRVWAAYTVEFANAIRLRGTYIGPLLVGLTVLLLTFQYPLERDPVSDFAFLAMAMPVSLDLVGTLAALVYCAVLIGADEGSGTIRFILVQPLKRLDYLLAKTLMAWTYVLVLILTATVLSIGVALFFGDLTGIYFGDQIVFSSVDMRNAFIIAVGLNLLPLFCVSSFAIFVSMMTRGRTAAITMTFGAWVFVDVLKQPLQIADFVFSTYLEFSWTVFADRCDAIMTPWFPGAWWQSGISVGWIFVCFNLSWLMLALRDFSE